MNLLFGKLFVQNAKQGLGFVDVCRGRYGVVPMNPPFGDASAIQEWRPDPQNRRG